MSAFYDLNEKRYIFSAETDARERIISYINPVCFPLLPRPLMEAPLNPENAVVFDPMKGIRRVSVMEYIATHSLSRTVMSEEERFTLQMTL